VERQANFLEIYYQIMQNYNPRRQSVGLLDICLGYI
jgi:hypothetical protein